MTPRIQTGLIETPSAASDNDAPKAGTVFIVGAAGQGPTTPQTITNPNDAYALYGRDSRLAEAIELSLQGARIGARVAGNGVYGRVVALRTDTGQKATVALEDAASDVVMTITARNASAKSNGWKIAALANGSVQGFTIYDPENDRSVDIAADFGGGAGVATATELAAAVRAAFAGQLDVEVHTGRQHTELALSSESVDTDAAAVVTSSNRLTTLALAGTSLATAQGMAPANLWIEGGTVANGAHAAGAAEAWKRRPAADNEDARFYAIAAGKAMAAPKGATVVDVPGIAPSAIIGVGGIKSLINVRTTGEGAGAEIALETAGQRAGDDVSEAYWRVRDEAIGRFDPVTAAATHDFLTGADGVEAVYALTFDAPEGISGDAVIAAAHAALQATTMTAAEADADRLGTKLDVALRLKAREISGTLVEELPLSIGAEVAGKVEAGIVWDDATGTATLYLNKVDFDGLFGDRLDEAELFVDFDSCVFDLTEKTPSTLNPASAGLEYAVTGQAVRFNKALKHELVVRPLTVTHYRLGDSVVAEAVDGGYTYHFHGERQPGEGGGAMGKLVSIIGMDYAYDPALPSVTAAGTFLAGGTPGDNASIADQVVALDEALAAYKDLPHQVLVTPGLWADAMKKGYDPATGRLVTQPAGVIDVVEQHLARASATGAPGIAYLSVRPMKASDAAGRYTDAQRTARLAELTEPSADDPSRLASQIAERSLPEVFLFDAPIDAFLGGKRVQTDGAALMAGIRSALPNSKALYQVRLPGAIAPLYRYDQASVDAPSVLSEARVNTWVARRGELVLADERTAAGLVADARGRLVPSSFQSGTSLIVAKAFQQAARERLANLIGPIPSGGIDVVIGTAITELRSLAGGIEGIQDIGLGNDSIKVVSEGGNAVGLRITVMLQVTGELRSITLDVGTVVQTQSAASGAGAIGLAA